MANVVTQSNRSVLSTSTTLAGAPPAAPKRPALSPEQAAIALGVKQADHNIVVIARAGTGKTYLIIKCLPLMRGTKAIAAFNRKIAAEVRQKVAKAGLSREVDVATFNSFASRVLKKRFKTMRLEGFEKGNAGFLKFTRIAEKLEIPRHLQAIVRKAIDRAMERLFGVVDPRTGRPFIEFNDKDAWLDLADHFDFAADLPPADNIEMQLLMATQGMSYEQAKYEMLLEALRYAVRAMKMSIRMAKEEFREITYVGTGKSRQAVEGAAFTGVITYAEQLYLPLYYNLDIPQYDHVLVDEAQDSNAARREFARRMMRFRAMFVGDPAQAINGFAGADNDSLDIITREFKCRVYKMTVTFRCGKTIVELAQTLVPDYKADNDNCDGTVRYIDEDQLPLETFRPGVNEHGTAYDAIICRNTAPLVRVAYKLIGKGVACHVEGREVGRDLISLAKRWPYLVTLSAYQDKLRSWSDGLIAQYKENDEEAKIEALTDQVESLEAMIKGLPPGARVSDLIAQINSLFSDTAAGQKPTTVTLCTAHKSKGLEFLRVFGLGVEKYMPSKNVTTNWGLEQENNLIYVLYTRAIEEYVGVRVA